MAQKAEITALIKNNAVSSFTVLETLEAKLKSADVKKVLSLGLDSYFQNAESSAVADVLLSLRNMNSGWTMDSDLDKMYNDLRQIKNAHGIEMPAPAFLFFGFQSCGKTSILSVVSGIPFGTMTDGTGTRCPVSYKMIHDPTCETEIIECTAPGKEPKQVQSYEEQVKLVFDHMKHLKKTMPFASEFYQVTIRSKSVPDMEFVDIPGLLGSGFDKDSELGPWRPQLEKIATDLLAQKHVIAGTGKTEYKYIPVFVKNVEEGRHEDPVDHINALLHKVRPNWKSESLFIINKIDKLSNYESAADFIENFGKMSKHGKTVFTSCNPTNKPTARLSRNVKKLIQHIKNVPKEEEEMWKKVFKDFQELKDEDLDELREKKLSICGVMVVKRLLRETMTQMVKNFIPPSNTWICPCCKLFNSINVNECANVEQCGGKRAPDLKLEKGSKVVVFNNGRAPFLTSVFPATWQICSLDKDEIDNQVTVKTLDKNGQNIASYPKNVVKPANWIDEMNGFFDSLVNWDPNPAKSKGNMKGIDFYGFKVLLNMLGGNYTDLQAMKIFSDLDMNCNVNGVLTFRSFIAWASNSILLTTLECIKGVRKWDDPKLPFYVAEPQKRDKKLSQAEDESNIYNIAWKLIKFKSSRKNKGFLKAVGASDDAQIASNSTRFAQEWQKKLVQVRANFEMKPHGIFVPSHMANAEADLGRDADKILRILVAGPQKSGKTSMIKTYVGKNLNPNEYEATGSSAVVYNTNYDGYKLDIIDTSGDEKYKYMRYNWLKQGIDILVIAFSRTDKAMFEEMQVELGDICRLLFNVAWDNSGKGWIILPRKVPIMIAQTKKDLYPHQNQPPEVSKAQFDGMMNRMKRVYYIKESECSTRSEEASRKRQLQMLFQNSIEMVEAVQDGSDGGINKKISEQFTKAEQESGSPLSQSEEPPAFTLVNPLVVMLGIGDYDNNVMPDLDGVPMDYANILDVFTNYWGYSVLYKNGHGETIYGSENIIKSKPQSLKSPKNSTMHPTAKGNVSIDEELMPLMPNGIDREYKLRWNIDEIENFTEEARNTLINNQHDGLLFVLSSHGESEEVIIDSTGEEYFLGSIFEVFLGQYSFENVNVVTEQIQYNDYLFEIPKLFFIDKCRGMMQLKAQKSRKSSASGPMINAAGAAAPGAKHSRLDQFMQSLGLPIPRILTASQSQDTNESIVFRGPSDKSSELKPTATRTTSIASSQEFKIHNKYADIFQLYSTVHGYSTADGQNGGMLIRSLAAIFRNIKFITQLGRRWSDVVIEIRRKTEKNSSIIHPDPKETQIQFTQIAEQRGTLRRNVKFIPNPSLKTSEITRMMDEIQFDVDLQEKFTFENLTNDIIGLRVESSHHGDAIRDTQLSNIIKALQNQQNEIDDTNEANKSNETSKRDHDHDQIDQQRLQKEFQEKGSPEHAAAAHGFHSYLEQNHQEFVIIQAQKSFSPQVGSDQCVFVTLINETKQELIYDRVQFFYRYLFFKNGKLNRLIHLDPKCDSGHKLTEKTCLGNGDKVETKCTVCSDLIRVSVRSPCYQCFVCDDFLLCHMCCAKRVIKS